MRLSNTLTAAVNDNRRPGYSNRYRYQQLGIVVVLGLICGTVQSAHLPGHSSTLLLAQNSPRPLVSGERVRVKKITRDIESALQQLEDDGAQTLQSPANVKKWQDSISRHQSALQKYPQLDDPDVKAARAKLTEMETLLAASVNQAQSQQAELGDVQARLSTIENALSANRPPQALKTPFTEQQASNWVKAAATAQQIAQQANQAIQQIGTAAHLPNNPGTVQSGAPYDRNDLNRLLNVANRNQQAINTAMEHTKTNLIHQLKMQEQSLDYFRQLDPAKPNDRMNAFLKEGADTAIYQRLDQQLALAKSAAAWQTALQTPVSADVTARINEIKALRQRYSEQRADALGDSNLPTAKSTDPALINIANQILATPKYGFGEHGPIIITTNNVVEREKQLSHTEYNDVEVSLNGDITLSGTETTWNYRWEEFKFATPIKAADSDNWHVWWITAKKFSSGAEKTPIGQWVSGTATRGDLIKPENF